MPNMPEVNSQSVEASELIVHDIQFRELTKFPNQLLGIAPIGEHKLTTHMKRLLPALYALVQQTGIADRYYVSLQWVLNEAKLVGLSSKQVIEVFDSMRKISVKYNYRDSDYEWKIRTGLLTMVGEADHLLSKNKIYTFSMDPFLINAIINERGFFTKISLFVLVNLSKGQSISLYQICRMIASIRDKKFAEIDADGYVFTKWYAIDELIPILAGETKLESLDKKTNTYQPMPYKAIKRTYISGAIDEINALDLSDITVKCDERKKQRKVTHIRFGVKLREDVTVNKVVQKSVHDVPQALLNFGLQPSLVDQYIARFPLEYLKANIVYIQDRRFAKENPIKNLIQYTKAALEANYAGEIIADQNLNAKYQLDVLSLQEEEGRAREERIERERKLRNEQFTRFELLEDAPKEVLWDQILADMQVDQPQLLQLANGDKEDRRIKNWAAYWLYNKDYFNLNY